MTLDLEIHPDAVWPLHERLAHIAYELEKDPNHGETAQELWQVIVTLSRTLQGIVEEAMEEEDEDDDFIDYGEMPE